MPKGVTKQKFNRIKKYYDPEIFCAAGKRIRAMARAADKLSVEERIERITDIFSTFRNPDKETVLTPWRVVNMHLGDCLGGYNFFEKGYETTLSEPRFIDRGEVTATVFAEDSHILEINSKSGLYPLYMAYSIYRTRVKNSLFSVSSIEDGQRIWDKVVAENIFVICKTPMAKSITKRTLIGFRKAKVNTRYFEDLINQIKNKPEHFIKQVDKFITERTGIKNMKFNAIVGNPPYQVMDGGAGVSASPIYNAFVEISKAVKPNYISMIMPAKWYSGGKGLETFREKMLNDTSIKKLIDFADSRDCFPTADIAGGICYFLWDKEYNGLCHFTHNSNGKATTVLKALNSHDTLLRHPIAENVVAKIKSLSDSFFDSIVSSRKPFGLATNANIKEEGDLQIRHNKGVGYFNRHDVPIGKDMIDKWKVIISYLSAEHAAQPDKNGQFKILSSLVVLPPCCVCTETYLVAYVSDAKEQVESALKYFQTKFLRFLVSIMAISQHITKGCFVFVPQQDFTANSDIDWNKSIEEIDAQLYDKYNLSDEEIAFIESIIKPM